jgi:hypothetical protein
VTTEYDYVAFAAQDLSVVGDSQAGRPRIFLPHLRPIASVDFTEIPPGLVVGCS